MVQIVVRIIYIALGLIIAFMISFTIFAIKLYKSNNLGNHESISNAFNFTIIKTKHSFLSEDIYNPVMLKRMNLNDGGSYSISKSKSLEEEIENSDFSNVKWHS